MSKYIDAKQFSDFKTNQDTLIKILNHNMTKITTDVSWLKRLVGWQVGLFSVIGVTVLCGFIKLVFV